MRWCLCVVFALLVSNANAAWQEVWEETTYSVTVVPAPVWEEITYPVTVTPAPEWKKCDLGNWHQVQPPSYVEERHGKHLVQPPSYVEQRRGYMKRWVWVNDPPPIIYETMPVYVAPLPSYYVPCR